MSNPPWIAADPGRESAQLPVDDEVETIGVAGADGVPAGGVPADGVPEPTGESADAEGADLVLEVAPRGEDRAVSTLRAGARRTSRGRGWPRRNRAVPVSLPRFTLPSPVLPRSRRSHGGDEQVLESATLVVGGHSEHGEGRGAVTTAASLAGLAGCLLVGFALGGGFPGTTGGHDATVVDAVAEAGTLEVADDAGAEAAAGTPPDADVDGCTEVSEPGHRRGNGPGDTATAEGLVLAFEHAYYVRRDAGAAVALVAEDSGIEAGTLAEEGIALLPAGTTHCVDVRLREPGLVAVELTEFRPGRTPIGIHQNVRVERTDGGEQRIAGIEHVAAG